ncbi:sulfite exporter TauE/SafE family protein [Oscillochloris sp. ZM17-4]|uniref:sulfite exporter TauE/SafE family protein n=1 Tax=Oscillochloris sp. ZM17-4 TaxID=2866714 RepID=UPI001C72C8EC|nr:sulfite exporter TauE/SafE family protein [Oscillochloris sp. ZM17-4]MBX0328937.1 sulfite exporter TauE/SafE family protein [Oscillochloris sp. ZM17-4]
MMHFEIWQWAMAAAGAFLIGLSKTGIGGIGLFAVVIFASLMPPRESVGVVLIILLAGDLVAISVYRRDADWGHLLRLFPWAGLGVIIGAVATGMLPDALMRVLLGAIVVALTIAQAIRSWRAPAADALPRWLGPVAGLFAGITTMIANAGGPPMAIYLLAARLPKITFIGTTAWFFLAINLFKVPFSYSLGMITAGSLWLSLRLAPFAILGALLGRRLVSGMNQRVFEGIVLALTLVAGLRLLLG